MNSLLVKKSVSPDFEKQKRQKNIFHFRNLFKSKVSIVLLRISLFFLSFATGINYSDNRQSYLCDAFFYHNQEIVWTNTKREAGIHMGVFHPGTMPLPCINRFITGLGTKSETTVGFSDEQLKMICENANALPAERNSFDLTEVLDSPLAKDLKKAGKYGEFNLVINENTKGASAFISISNEGQGGRLPKSSEEIAISDANAALLVANGYKNDLGETIKPSTVSELIGIDLLGRKIVGIFKTQFLGSSFENASMSLTDLNSEGRLEQYKDFVQANKKIASFVVFKENAATSSFFLKTRGNLFGDLMFLLVLGSDAPFHDKTLYGPAITMSWPISIAIFYTLALLFAILSIVIGHVSFSKSLSKEEISIYIENRPQKRKIFGWVYSKMIAVHLLFGGAAILASQISFAIINSIAGEFLFSHFAISAAIVLALTALVDLLVAASKTKQILRKLSGITDNNAEKQ